MASGIAHTVVVTATSAGETSAASAPVTATANGSTRGRVGRTHSGALAGPRESASASPASTARRARGGRLPTRSVSMSFSTVTT